MSVKFSAVLAMMCLGALVGLAAEPLDVSKLSPSIVQVVKMHESGVAADVLLAYVKETPISKPNAEEVLYLTEKGIPKDVIVALLSKRVWADTAAPQSQTAQAQPQGQTQTALPPAVTPAQPASQSVVYVQQPAPVITYAAPYYYPYYPYYRPWYGPSISFGIGFGHHWGGHHWHHGGGIHVRHR